MVCDPSPYSDKSVSKHKPQVTVIINQERENKMIYQNQENEHLTNTIATVLLSILLGGLVGALTLLLPSR